MKNTIFIMGLLISAIAFIQSCKKSNTDPDSDRMLYSEITASGFTYYQGGAILNGVSPSPHGAFKLRFNATAAAALDSTGELPVGGTFPTGSMLVKEVHSNNNVSLFAVMKKAPSDKNSGSGWVWAEFNTDGSTVFSTGKKGDGCISCHSEVPNRDLSRTFDLH